MNEPLLVGLVGDLLVMREDPASAFRGVEDVLRAPDILFGNLEGTYCTTPEPPRGIPIALTGKIDQLDVFARLGFRVMSMANNHIVDNGAAVMLDNMERLRAQGIMPCGVGENLAAARKPAIVEANGLRIAFLAYASVFPMGYEATATVPGLAPCRSYDHWRPRLDSYYIPGAGPLALSVPNETDLANLREDIASAKKEADLVFASFHWGDFLRPYHVSDHERKTARLCINAGVDMVIGHHHHAIRGMEWYKGKPIFYGLGHFVFELPLGGSEEDRKRYTRKGKGHASDYSVFLREGWPFLPLHADTRMTIMGFAEIEDGRVTHIGALPCRLRPDGSVDAVALDSDEGCEILDYLEACNTHEELNGHVVREGAPRIAGYATVRIEPDDASS